MTIGDSSQVGLASAIERYNAGVRAMQAGDSNAAAEEWMQAVTLDPGMAPAWRNLAVYHEERGNDAAVFDAYERLLQFDPFDTQALIRGASAARRQGKVEFAIRLYERAIAVYPYFRFWYEELAALCDQFGDTDAGERWRAKAREYSDDTAEMAFEDGVRRARAGDQELTIAIFEAVLEEQPNNIDVRVRIAAALHASGRTKEAVKHFNDALSSTETVTPLVLYHRARLLVDLGRTDDAADDLQAAVELAPEFGRAKRLLVRLGGAPPGKLEAKDLASRREEPVSRSVRHAGPVLDTPNPETGWLEQVGFLVNQAATVQSRTGQPGHVAILFDAAAQLIPITRSVLKLVESDGAGLVGDGVQRIYLIEGEARSGAGTHGVMTEGWLKSGDNGPDYGCWNPEPSGIPIDRMMESAQLAVGADGFNLVLIVGTGLVRPDQNATAQFARSLATYQVALVLPREPLGDLAERLADCVPNFVTIQAQTW